jgi:hypothetical protein
MVQASWFDFVEKERDPVHVELEKLTIANYKIKIASCTVTLNSFNLIEIEGDGVHDYVSDIDSCYRYFCKSDQ